MLRQPRSSRYRAGNCEKERGRREGRGRERERERDRLGNVLRFPVPFPGSFEMLFSTFFNLFSFFFFAFIRDEHKHFLGEGAKRKNDGEKSRRGKKPRSDASLEDEQKSSAAIRTDRMYQESLRGERKKRYHSRSR